MHLHRCIHHVTRDTVDVRFASPLRSPRSLRSKKKGCVQVSVVRHAIVVFVLALAARGASAQSSSSDAAQCFGFSFGAWHPPLDFAVAGHRAPLADQPPVKAPGGRDWASDAMPNDTTLLLFPAWWPAGVYVTFARRPRADADTVAGDAVALVADGRVQAPRAQLRAWRVPCR
jgi:hypothetical protein